MPVLNGKAFIGQTLKTVLDQRFDSYEVIVVDDGSTDRTNELVGSYFVENRNTGIATKLIHQNNMGEVLPEIQIYIMQMANTLYSLMPMIL